MKWAAIIVALLIGVGRFTLFGHAANDWPIWIVPFYDIGVAYLFCMASANAFRGSLEMLGAVVAFLIYAGGTIYFTPAAHAWPGFYEKLAHYGCGFLLWAGLSGEWIALALLAAIFIEEGVIFFLIVRPALS